jgi:hypothetical protein
MPSTVDPNAVNVAIPLADTPIDATPIRANFAAIKAQFENALTDLEALEALIDTIPAGPTGPAGPEGPPGAPLQVLGTLPGVGSLPVSGSAGQAYIIDQALYVWNGAGWTNVGSLLGPTGPTGATGATGLTGPTGPAGPAGANGVNANITFVYHGASTSTARPNFPIVGWIGSVIPANAIDNDFRLAI